jgi:putative membrane protein
MNPIHDTLALLASGWGPGAHVGGWIWPIIPLVWVAVMGVLAWRGPLPRPTPPDPLDRAREVLAERYARGDLTTDEYRERHNNLR